MNTVDEAGRAMMEAMEKDFTTQRSPGKLQCPFASFNTNGVGHGLPTPRSGNSNRPAINGESQGSALHDPISSGPKSIHTHSRTRSDIEEGSEGARACPIRFLDSHDPEEVAKYFEEHKHEVPRSHEICVKRFQANADSIRELDAKYGSLVNMIQGLGHKHQPMLPEAPVQSDGYTEEEKRSSQKIEKWAQSVGDRQPSVQVNGKIKDQKPSEEPDEERVQYFDRPLKEVRVGESPSRPWGVPIPSKYLDRKDTSETYPSRSAKDSTPAPVDVNRAGVRAKKHSKKTDGKESDSHLFASDLADAPNGVNEETSKAKKCPFDPLGGAGLEPTEQQNITESTKPTTQKPALAGSGSGEAVDSTGASSQITNKALAMVADTRYLAGTRVENFGTLLIGYQGSEAQDLLQSLKDVKKDVHGR